jgi:translation initiation factor eIF-2B subunit beta
VKEFLYAAKEKKRSFRVFVAEGAPRFVRLAIVNQIIFHILKSSLLLFQCFNQIPGTFSRERAG